MNNLGSTIVASALAGALVRAAATSAATAFFGTVGTRLAVEALVVIATATTTAALRSFVLRTGLARLAGVPYLRQLSWKEERRS